MGTSTFSISRAQTQGRTLLNSSVSLSSHAQASAVVSRGTFSRTAPPVEIFGLRVLTTKLRVSNLPGTRSSVELVAQALNQHPRAVSATVDFLDGRRKENVDACFFNQRTIVFNLARIFSQIFCWAELSRIHKNGNDHVIAGRHGGLDQ